MSQPRGSFFHPKVLLLGMVHPLHLQSWPFWAEVPVPVAPDASSQIDALLGEGVRKLFLILLSIAVAYLSFSVILSESLAVLLATLVGCSVGVMCDGRQ